MGNDSTAMFDKHSGAHPTALLEDLRLAHDENAERHIIHIIGMGNDSTNIGKSGPLGKIFGKNIRRRFDFSHQLC